MKRKLTIAYMRKTAAVMAACALLLTGCGSSEKVIEGKTENGAVSEEASDKSAAQEEDSSKEAVSLKGYIFDYNGTKMAADADMAPILEALGEPDSYYEAASCAFDGLDKIYTYSSFEIDTYPANDKDYISNIIFKDDSIATAEGIAVGDSEDKVKETYGDFTEEVGKIVCEKDGMKLNFIIKEGMVASVEYQSTILDE